MRRHPAAAHWLSAEPITDIAVFGGLADRRRAFVVDGRPVVTGLVAVGDAWACTNPSLGRGASIGALHASVLRDTVAKEGLGDADALVNRFHDETERVVGPYVDATLAFDHHRLAAIEADIAGEAYRPDDPGWTMATALNVGARHDPELTRAHAVIACAARHTRRGLRRRGAARARAAVGGPPVAVARPEPGRAARDAGRVVAEIALSGASPPPNPLTATSAGRGRP